ncbi:MAG: hypothetical protein FWF20_01300 [Betaproteobacteria bacterium]|nr:hypothetical protein [Betaproteobacteria bacterium]MCL2885418.1 hypothetical protein [Betaproteobacteria bacterium]
MEIFRRITRQASPGRIIKSFAVLLILLALGYILALSSAKLELGGSSPGQQVLGKAPLAGQRAMEQFCTGITATPRNIWLVGYREYADEIPASALDLGSLLPQSADEAQRWGSMALQARSLTLRNGEGVTLISRLGEDGEFHVLAFVDGRARLISSPDGENLFLLTGLNLAPDEKRPYRQSAVFRTSDQGKTWQALLENGFMAMTERSKAYFLEPYFYNNNEVWAWGGYEDFERIFYSPDQGEHTEAIELSKKLYADMRPRGDYTNTIKAHVVQLDAQQAKVWVSDRYWDGRNWEAITREGQLTRKEGRWELGEVRTHQGLFIYQLISNGKGRIIAAVSQGNIFDAELAELLVGDHSWKRLSTLPNPFWPFPADSSIRSNQEHNFFASDDVILATIDSDHKVPRWLYPWGRYPANISADAVYFSKNNGRTWTKLAIPGYLGVLGFNAGKKQVYWNKGNWYENDDPNIYSYDLSR